MLSIRRILYPTDQSPSAARAYTWAARLAAGLGAELHAVHVVEPGLEAGERRVEPGELVPGAPPAGVSLQRRVVHGEGAAAEIVRYCQAEDIDLVVMGTGSRSGLRRLLVGSVAEQVVREAPCPVMTVPLRAPAEAVERVLAAVDFSAFSQMTLRHASAFAAFYGARLDVVHVLQEVTIPSAYGPELAPMVTPALEQRSREVLDELVQSLGPLDIPIQTHVGFGYPASEILHFANEYTVDLIVMSTHGLTGLEHFLIGSVAEKVVRKAPCPVLTVRAYGKSIVAAAAS